MITRSQSAKMAEQQRMQQETDSGSEIFEINNQLGLDNLFDEETDITTETSEYTGARGPSVATETSESTGVREPESGKSDDGIQMMLAKMMKMLEQNNQEQKKMSKEQKQSSKKLEKLSQEQKQLEENLNKKLDTAISEIQVSLTTTNCRIDNVQKEMTELVQKEVAELKASVTQDINKTKQENTKLTENLKGELAKTNKKIDAIVEKQNDNVRKAKQELVKEIQEVKEENKQKINDIEIKIQKHKEGEKERVTAIINDSQEPIKRRLDAVEARPLTRGNDNETSKEISFNGENAFPMEFLNELEAIKETYYPGTGTRWISRYLEGEAAVWWRVMRPKVNNYEEFRSAFMERYWSSQRQEKVRDRLEYGRYRPGEGINMSQYMERMVLECRQLIPAMSDQQLIRKMARHFSREIEIAVLTRGIRNICDFELLLQEYQHIKGWSDHSMEKQNKWQPYNRRPDGTDINHSHFRPGNKPVGNESTVDKGEPTKASFKKEGGYGNKRSFIPESAAPSTSKN
jgi:hypothetical protein